MKVLYITMCAPYDKVSHAGGQTLNYYIKKMAAQENVKVDLVTYCSADIEREIVEDLDGINKHLIIRIDYFKNTLRNFFSINSKFNPFHKYCNLMTWNAANLLTEKLKEIKMNGYEPDVIIMEWTQIVLQIESIKKIYPQAKYVASEHDVTYLGIQRKAKSTNSKSNKIYKMIQAWNTYKRECCALKKCDLIITHNEKDKLLLKKAGFTNSQIISLVPYYHKSKLSYYRKNDDILFFGYMKRDENITAVKWFIDNVMPLINDLPSKFVILGGGINDEIKKLESNKIVITGYVPIIDDYFAHAMCFVSPLLQGAGIKVKVLEAMYTDIPVLTNSIGIEGIPALDGKDYIYCEKPEEYERIIRLIYKYKLSPSGKEFVNKTFNLEKSFTEYFSAIKCCVLQEFS